MPRYKGGQAVSESRSEPGSSQPDLAVLYDLDILEITDRETQVIDGGT